MLIACNQYICLIFDKYLLFRGGRINGFRRGAIRDFHVLNRGSCPRRPEGYDRMYSSRRVFRVPIKVIVIDHQLKKGVYLRRSRRGAQQPGHGGRKGVHHERPAYIHGNSVFTFILFFLSSKILSITAFIFSFRPIDC